MLQPSSRRTRPWTNNVLPGVAAVLVVSLLSSGCTDRESSGEDSTAQASAQPTSRELFIDHCGSCHGVEGRGDGPLAAEFRVAPANLRLLKQENNGTFPNSVVQRSIDGRGMPRAHGLPDMPVWGRYWIREGIGEAGIKARVIAITSYISSIQE